MANAIYDLARQKFLDGEISWTSDNIRVLLVSSGYIPNLSSDEFYSDIGDSNIVATSTNLIGKSSTAGVADAGNITFSAVSGSTITQIVIYQDTGSFFTSPLIARINSGTGLPIVPNGGDITITWSNSEDKIFKL